MYLSSKHGFVLSDFLISLAVVGLIAVLVLPQIVKNFERRNTTVKLKHFYSLMQNALKLSQVDNGEMFTWNKEIVARDSENKLIMSDRVEKGEKFARSYILPYFSYVKAGVEQTQWAFEKNLVTDMEMFIVYLKNGSSFGFLNGDCINIYFDANGNNSPNKNGIDRFFYVLCTKDTPRHKDFVIKAGFQGYKKDRNYYTRSLLKSDCKSESLYCTALLEYDKWIFKDDYPW